MALRSTVLEAAKGRDHQTRGEKTLKTSAALR